MNDKKKATPNRLKTLRERSRLSQTEVAKLLDISLSTVCRHENSSRGLQKEVLIGYAKLYKVTSAEVFVDLDTLQEEEDISEE
jgi:transcriptional regulator with XRE-family HTH domain